MCVWPVDSGSKWKCGRPGMGNRATMTGNDFMDIVRETLQPRQHHSSANGGHANWFSKFLARTSARDYSLGVIKGARFAALILAVAFTLLPVGFAEAQKRPNFVVIMTDDQDDLDWIRHLPAIRNLLAKQGITFKNSFTDLPLCCPSRASFLTGQSSTNHGILFNAPPNGGYVEFAAREHNSLGVWLQEAGYRTGFIGKIMNGFGVSDPSHIMPGWDDFQALITGGYPEESGGYFNVQMSENGTLRAYGDFAGEYSTDVITRKGVEFVVRYAQRPKPFFLLLTPVAPHTGGLNKPPRAAPRHRGVFADLDFPIRPNFNEANISDKPGHIRELPLLTAEEQLQVARVYRTRLESLLAVDDMVRKLYGALRTIGELENTFFILTSDNGFSLGSHRWVQKQLPYEESLRVPLIIRGPKLPHNQSRDQLVTNLDIVATIMALAEATTTKSQFLDGRSLVPLFQDGSIAWRSAFAIHGSTKLTRGEQMSIFGVRSKRYKYIRSKSNVYGAEEEFYDLVEDPYELTSRIGTERYGATIRFLRFLSKELETCAGQTCWVATKPPDP